ncbi:cytochrome b/b6 domain-containing protein [bacterium]|nr:cytochrome b/b6 domain-containing protein [bacterium]
MKKFNTIFISILCFLLSETAAFADQTSMHPQIPLVDLNGTHVLTSGNPVSTMKTCGACHDTDYIEKHNYHALLGLNEFGHPDTEYQGYSWELTSGMFGAWNPLRYEVLSDMNDERIDLGTVDWIRRFGAFHAGGGPASYGRDGTPFSDYTQNDKNRVETSVYESNSGNRIAWDWKKSGTIEHNCFLCHTDAPNNQSRIHEIEQGNFKWVNTATLLTKGIIEKNGSGWVWNRDSFQADGKIKEGLLTIREPKTGNCGICHPMVQDDPSRGFISAEGFTHKKSSGEIFSPFLISKSVNNVKNKNSLFRSWDIHAERQLGCNSCHFSINNPAFYQESERTRPKHLRCEGRKMSIGDFLKRPSHKLANMRIRHEIEFSEPDNIVHRCESCHDPYTGHDFLPYKKRHIWALGCESCHIPTINAPALQQLDWSILTEEGGAVETYRGVPESGEVGYDTVVTGYSPSWFTRTLAGKSSLLPYNLVTSLYWVEGDPQRPVRKAILEKLYLNGKHYRPDILKLFDQNKDGKLDLKEQVLNSPEKVAFIRNELIKLGVQHPELNAEIRPFSVHHGVTGRKGALKDCYECHGSQSRFTQPVVLASYLPDYVIPQLAPNSFIELEGELNRLEDGSLVFNPRPKARGLYLLGRYRNNWVDIIGLLALVGVIFGVALHGGLRILTSKTIKHRDKVISREYMYPVYERLWHWLQAGSIIMFIITGLEIHFADKFSLLGYVNAVRIHEIVAFVFIANALLSIAYHITAGEIKNYLPQPASFIDESWKQVIFYIRGIFQGAEHPIEKSPERRLNPLQQVTYLMILYVLIPVQTLTGILIWGAERWPEFIEKLGGLSVIAPLHTLCAWFFFAFLIMHIYLATTGHTPMTNIVAMITGWEDVELKTDPKGVLNNEK